MQVLFIRTTRGISGAEKYNLNLLEELKKEKNVAVAFITDNKRLFSLVSSLKVPSYMLNIQIPEVGTKKEFVVGLIRWIPLFIAYQRILRKIKAECVVLESRTEKLFLTIPLRLQGYNVVWLEHGPFFVSQCSAIVKALFPFASRWAHGILAVSQDTKQDLVQGGIPSDKVEVIYIGVDPKKFLPLHKKPQNNVTVGFLGSVTEEKGIEQFMATAEMLCRRDKRWNFVVMGDGPKLEWARETSRLKGINKKFTFTGFTEEVPKYLKQVDIILFPTNHHEGISMALLEAQGMGIPIVAHDIGGNKEIIADGVNGLLYKQPTEILSIMENLGSDRALREKIGRKARKNIESRFNIQKQANKFEEYFLHI